jgi:hypothetical protein
LRGADDALRAQERRADGGGYGAGTDGGATSVAVAFCCEGNWSDERVLAKVRELVLPEMERHGPIEDGSEPIEVFFSRSNPENYRYDPATGRMRFQIPTVPTPWGT